MGLSLNWARVVVILKRRGNPLIKRGRVFWYSFKIYVFIEYRREFMIGCMNLDEARGVCKDRSRRHSVVSAHGGHGKKA